MGIAKDIVQVNLLQSFATAKQNPTAVEEAVQRNPALTRGQINLGMLNTNHKCRECSY